VIQDGLSRATYPALVSGHQNRNDAKGAISTNMPGYTPTINLPLAAVTGFGIGPHHDVGEQLTIQPQLPLPLDADWNLIVRSGKQLIDYLYPQTAEGRRSSFPPLVRAGTGKVLGGIARRGGPALHGSARDLLWQSSWHWREAAH
jgi:hypothetical protein